MEQIKFYKTIESAVIPTKRDEDAAFDLYAVFDEDYVTIHPGETVKFNTGLKAVIPSDVWVLLKERSSTAKTGLSIRSGVIDSGYRGEWCIMMTNCGRDPICITKNYDGKPTLDCSRDPFCIPKDYDGKPTLVVRKDLARNYWVMSAKKAIAQAVIMPKLNVGCAEITAEEFNAAPETIRGEGGWGDSGK